ncbi:MAG: glycosyltransferase WbuB [Nitrospira bacterium HGW-Nitrospira-1]|nr:MAG: glycosyltransferase WbuB [Nitrospira bacterium HGW-Nitrospira-1]
MNILIVTQYFWPEEFRINELAATMAERGHQVTVLTGIPNYPGGKFLPGYGFTRQKTENYKGIKVVRVPLLPRGRGGGIRLVLNYFSFALIASLLGPIKCCDAYDVIFVYEPSPITVGLPAIIMKKLKSAPIMFWVQDLWPESLSATGAVHSKSIMKAVEMLVRFIYSHCDRILVQSRSFIDAIVRTGVDRSKIEYFPNSAEAIFDSAAECAGEMEHIKFPKGFRVMFAGNIGAAQDFETILRAAELLKEHGDIHWMIVGDGCLLPWVREQVEIRVLGKTVRLLGRYPLASMPAFYAMADVMLVALKKDPIFALTIPAKVQSYLACGKPIIAVLDGECGRLIEESKAGLSCPAGDSHALAEAVLEMYKMPKSELENMGKHGREFYLINFERNMLIDRLQLWMQELLKRE